MSSTIFNVPPPYSEPCSEYRPGSAERGKLEQALKDILSAAPHEVPCVVRSLRGSKRPLTVQINGKAVHTGNIGEQRMPSDHQRVLAKYHRADAELVQQAIDGALAAKEAWDAVPFGQKTAIWHRAAAMFSGSWRYKIMAATMLGQGKNAWQAEIDAGAEASTVPFTRQC